MTRLMGDATHAAVPQLAAIRGQLQLVAGYDTGDASIDWTAADWSQFPGVPHVTIDQGFTGSPNLSATVRDVEYGAWAPGQAVNRAGWNVPRPTIYCTTGETGYNLATVLADGWKGDLWLAIAGWQPGNSLPAAPGCTIVAVQSNYNNPAYDLSYVLDPAWPLPAAPGPKGNKMDTFIVWGTSKVVLVCCGRSHVITPGEAGVYQSIGIPQSTGPAASDAEIAALLADFPPGEVAVTVPPVAFPPLTATTTITHA